MTSPELNHKYLPQSITLLVTNSEKGICLNESEFKDNEPTYQTRWLGAVKIEDILGDPQVRKVAFAKMRAMGHLNDDAEDCFQLGTINLWKALKQDRELLTDKGAAWVGIWVALSGSRRALSRHRKRNVPLFETTSVDGTRPERWANFASQIDQRIDYAILMNTLAQQYACDPVKLLALRTLTTSLSMKDSMGIGGTHKNQMIKARNAVKADLQQYFLEQQLKISEEIDWAKMIKAGEKLECVERVANRITQNQRLLLALYVLTTSAKRKDVAELFDIGLTTFRKDIAKVKGLLASEYRRSYLIQPSKSAL